MKNIRNFITIYLCISLATLSTGYSAEQTFHSQNLRGLATEIGLESVDSPVEEMPNEHRALNSLARAASKTCSKTDCDLDEALVAAAAVVIILLIGGCCWKKSRNNSSDEENS